jgi:hypothetical protein
MEPEKRKVQDASRPLIVSLVLALIHLPICSSRRSAFADKPRRQPGKLSLLSSKRRKRSALPRYVLRGSYTHDRLAFEFSPCSAFARQERARRAALLEKVRDVLCQPPG